MTTTEPEITAAVDLCLPGGLVLNPAARGWSRRPLHRANLALGTGRVKRWEYWAVLAGDLVLSATCADIDVVTLADVYWADLTSGEIGGGSTILAPGAVLLPASVGAAPVEVVDGPFHLRLADDEHATTIAARWREVDGREGHLDVTVAKPAGHESLNVVIPWSDDLFTVTSKQQARPATGELVVGARHETIGVDAPAWGVQDYGRGRWPAAVTWNWGGGAGTSDGQVVGLQFGAKWTAGTGFTENGILVNGRLSKIGRELEWSYDWDEPMRPWRVVDPDGQLDVTLTPRYDRHSAVEVSAELASEVHQVFGTWSGRLRDDDGRELVVSDLMGFAEEARQRW